MTYNSTTLANGITVVTDTMPDVRSIALGLWFNVGSRDEQPDQAGLTHFMEHMMFKGTPTRSALDISMQFDQLGAVLNAFTSKEYTCYYARFVDDKLESALSILADMVLNSSFSDETIEPERKVVLEEISRTQDTPDDYIYDVFGDALLPGHPLGKPVLGTRELVAGYRHADCARFHQQHYFSGNLTIAAAGNVNHDTLVALAEKYLGGMACADKEVRSLVVPEQRQLFKAVTKETEQAHVLYGMPWMAADDDRRFAGAMLSSILGGSMSSRLFYEVREKLGLVYAIYTHASGFQHLGSFSVYAGTNPENIAEVVSIIRRELGEMADKGPTEEEMFRTRESLCGHILLSLEATNSRMMRLGRNFTVGMPVMSADEMVARYHAVSAEDVRSAAADFLRADPTIAVISPYDAEKVADLVKEH